MHKSKHQRVKELFETKRSVYNYELNKIAFRYGSIIHDMRKDGHVIVTNRINNDGLVQYIYKGKGENNEQV